MKTTSNKDMLNAIRNNSSEEYKEKIPAVMSDEDIMLIDAKLKDFPSLKNEFINTLTNKVVKTEFFSRVYENPLKMLKKGMLPYGNTIEELFVQHATAKGFWKDNAFHGTNAAGQQGTESSIGELVGKKAATIKQLYISRNFAYVFDVSISDAQLKSAFMNANGLSDLVNQLVGSLSSGAELREYQDMIALIKAAAAGVQLKQKSGSATGELEISDSSFATNDNYLTKNEGIQNAMHVEVIDKGGDARFGTNSYTHNLAVKLRATAQRLKFMNTKYNMAGVPTFSRLEDLVFLTTPENMAKMDVEVLASAFNISHAEAQLRIIVVDELPKIFASQLNSSGKPAKYWKNGGNNTETTASSANTSKCLGILMDVNFLQVIDTVNESRQFENGRNLMTNVFLHKQGIMANCYFANCVAFLQKADADA